MAQHVRHIMTSAPLTEEPRAVVRAVAQLMRDQDLGAVLVTDGDRLRGLVSDRDLVTVGPDEDLAYAMEPMREHSVRRLPVVDEGRPVGIVSLGDLAVERDPGSALGHIGAAPPNT